MTARRVFTRLPGRLILHSKQLFFRGLTDLVEISGEIRELLVQIRDGLVEGEEAEPEGVDTVVITEAEVPEPSEDEL